MGLMDQIDLKPLIDAYLFANTPMYLYRHFRNNASLQELAERTSIQILVAEYDRRTVKETRSIEDIVVAYSTLIAITFLKYQRALEVFENLGLSRLDWGDEIRSIFTSTTKIVNVFRETVKPKSYVDRTKSDSSQNELFVTPQPKITVMEG